MIRAQAAGVISLADWKNCRLEVNDANLSEF